MKSFFTVLKEEKDMWLIFIILAISLLLGIACTIFAFSQPFR